MSQCHFPQVTTAQSLPGQPLPNQAPGAAGTGASQNGPGGGRGRSLRPTHRDWAAVLGAVGGVVARGRRGRRGRGRGRGGRLPVLAGALGLGLDAALVQGEGVLALELQALGRHCLVAGLAGAVVAPAQLDAPAEALHDRAMPRQRELRHGAGGQHHGPRAARAGPGAGLPGRLALRDPLTAGGRPPHGRAMAPRAAERARARQRVFLRPRSARPRPALAAHLRPWPGPAAPGPLFSAPPPPPS